MSSGQTDPAVGDAMLATRYKLLVSMAADYAASIAVNEDGSLASEWVVGSFEDITGYKIHHGQPAQLDSTHPDDRERQQRDIDRTLQNHPTVTEFRSLKPDGSVVWLRLSRKPVWDEELQRVTRYFAVAHDITAGKQTELALAESEARYKLLTSMTSDYAASILVAADGSLTTEWVVGSYESITGYPVQYNQPASLSSTHPDDLDRQRRDIAETMQNRPTTSEFRMLRPDGSEIWLRITRKPIWDETLKRVSRFITVAQDITERKQAEQALTDSETRYRLLSSMTSDYAACLRVEEDGTLVTEWAVGSFQEITGQVIQMGKPAKLQSTHPDDIERQQEDIAQTLKNNPTVTEFRTMKPDGTKIWLRISRKPIWDEAQQRVTHFIAVAQDVTERREAEEELRRTQVLQAELDGIRKTVATLAHEINNPLTGIIATLQMGTEPDIEQEELDEMLTAALGAARAIRDVVAKIQRIREPSYRPYLTDREIIDIRDESPAQPD